MAALQQIFGTPPLPVHQFSGKLATVGRHEDCDVVVDSPAVSRCHARIIYENRRYFIEDLNSRNGTMVNAKRIHSRTLLNDGDLVDIATLPFRFLSQEVPNDDSDGWGTQPAVITVTESSEDDDRSARRMIVKAGDRVSSEELGSDPLRPSQLISRIQIEDESAAWPIVDQAAMKLNSTLRLLSALRQAITHEEVIERAIQEFMGNFTAAERISIVLRDTQPTDIKVMAAIARREAEEVQICLPVIRTAMQNCEALLYTEHWRGEDPENPGGTVGTVLVVPLVGRLGHSIGAVQMDSLDNRNTLRAEDLERLVVLNYVVSFVLEQVHDLQRKIFDAVRERSTLDANQLRAEFSPATPPVVSGFRLAHEQLSGSGVVGDLVDYVRLSDGRVACLMIDVPGRDSEATRLMALLSRLLTGALSETGSAARAILETERLLHERVDEVPDVISVAIVILDRERSEVTVSVAGHCPLFLIRSAELQQITSDSIVGAPLGQTRSERTEGRLQLNDNDMLVMFSEGIKRLISEGRSVWSDSQLTTVLADAAAENRTVFESRLMRRLRDLCGADAVLDDLIFAVVHRHKDAGTIDAHGLRGIDADTMDA